MSEIKEHREMLFDSEFFSKLQMLKLAPKLRLRDGYQGGRRSAAKGSSVEFSDFREYLPGDDIRRIDWNVYGRMDRLFVKLFMEEKEVSYRILLDCSKSMNYGSKKKSLTAGRIAAMLSYIILNNMDRVSLSACHHAGDISTKSLTGRQSFQTMMNAIERLGFDGESDYLAWIRTLPFSRKGVVILISDFFENHSSSRQMHESITETVRYLLYQKQEVILVHVLSREEMQPDIEGDLNLIDSETQGEMRVSVSQSLLRDYNSTLNRFLNGMKELSNKYELQYIPVVSDEPLEQFIQRGLRTGQFDRR